MCGHLGNRVKSFVEEDYMMTIERRKCLFVTSGEVIYQDNRKKKKLQ